MLDLLDNLDPNIAIIGIIIAIIILIAIGPKKEEDPTITKEKVIYDKFFFWDLWDKITTVFMYVYFLGIFLGLAWMIFQCGGNWIDTIVAFTIFMGIQFLMIWKL
jgi:hypothetical protein